LIRSDVFEKNDSSFPKQLEESGCKMLTFGAESGDERILELVNKKASVEHVISANRKLKVTDIRPHFVTIRGFPTETKKEIARTYSLMGKLLLENKKAIFDSPCLIATPSTKMAEMSLGDLVINYSLEDWAGILDLFQDQKPPWVLDETYEFIQKHPVFMALISKLKNPSRINLLYRQIMRGYVVSLNLGLSVQFDILIRKLGRIVGKQIL
jgi:anaerobic magnesium-protoporphyrin IX monomethyl ester cyclase